MYLCGREQGGRYLCGRDQGSRYLCGREQGGRYFVVAQGGRYLVVESEVVGTSWKRTGWWVENEAVGPS